MDYIEEKKRMKGIKLISTPWDEKESVEISKRLGKTVSHFCKKYGIKEENFIEAAIAEKLQKVRKQ